MEFLEKFRNYAINNKDFDAVFIAGSRTDCRAKRVDKYSDIDLFIITEKNKEYLNNKDWLKFYDEEIIYFNDPISVGVGEELRVAFGDGLLSDIAIVNMQEFNLLKQNKIFNEKILARGFETIKNKYDKSITNYTMIEECALSEKYLNRLMDEFYIDIFNIIKYLKRNDMFSAKYAFDRRITKIIIKVTELYARSNGIEDTYFNGRYMERWLDKTTLREVGEIESTRDYDKMVECIEKSIVYVKDKIENLLKKYNYKRDVDCKKIEENLWGILNEE